MRGRPPVHRFTITTATRPSTAASARSMSSESVGIAGADADEPTLAEPSLLAGFGSAAAPLTLAVFTIIPVADGLTLMINVNVPLRTGGP